MTEKSSTDSTGTGADCSSEAAESEDTGALEADLAHLRPGVRGHIARRRARGLTLRERIFELHVGQAQPLLQVARALGVNVHLVSYHWLRLQKQIIANSPRSPDDFAVLRERISAMLWQTIQLTCPAPSAEASSFALRATEDKSEAGEAKSMPMHVAAGGEVAERAALPVAMPVPALVPPAPMLAIRLKALEQLARLYDLGLDTRTPAFAPQPYATSEEIARSVRERVLELHERSERHVG
jgi:DNA-binding CsgD family transcriptional regulator